MEYKKGKKNGNYSIKCRDKEEEGEFSENEDDHCDWFWVNSDYYSNFMNFIDEDKEKCIVESMV